jgi:hypothetical protein
MIRGFQRKIYKKEIRKNQRIAKSKGGELIPRSESSTR